MAARPQIFAVLNLANVAAALQLRFLPSGGAAASRTMTLSPNQRVTLMRSDFAALNAADFATVAEYDQPIVVDRKMSWGGGYGSHAETGVATPSPT